ncbi:MAG: sulfatase-like hydrolase/transferase [Terriglobales bacterium]
MSTTLLPPPPIAAASARRTWPGALWRYLVCFALLPNLPFWLLAPREGVAAAGWLSLDALLLGVVALYLRPSLVYPLFVVDFFLDVAAAICHTFGIGFVDVARSAGYITQTLAHAQLRSIAIWIGLILAVVGAAWIWLRPRLQPPQRPAFAAILLAISLLWAGAAHVAPSRSFVSRSLRSPAADFAHAWRRESIWNRLRGVGPDALTTAASAADQTQPFLRTGQPNLVVVLVESWGDANSVALRSALVQPFVSAALAQRYQVRQGLVHFNGPTGDGIMRELCDLNLGVAPEGSLAKPAQLQTCLPSRLQHQGYRTLALDSVAGFWPGGAAFYRQFGIQQVVAYPQLHAQGLADFIAGPFRAVRDQDTAAQLPKLLQASSPQPTFVFYLTVSAHLPIHLPLPASYNAACSLAPAVRDSAQACGWYRIERLTLASIAAAAMAPGLPPTVFAIVGDHNPPFVDTARDDFSLDQVPYVILAPHPRR